MTVSLSTLLQQFLKQSAPSVMMYSASLIKQAVAISSVKDVSNQSKHRPIHAHCVIAKIFPYFLTTSYNETSGDCKFAVCTRKEAVPGQENWENLTPTLTVTISPVPASMLTFTVSLAMLAVQL